MTVKGPFHNNGLSNGDDGDGDGGGAIYGQNGRGMKRRKMEKKCSLGPTLRLCFTWHSEPIYSDDRRKKRERERGTSYHSKTLRLRPSFFKLSSSYFIRDSRSERRPRGKERWREEGERFASESLGFIFIGLNLSLSSHERGEAVLRVPAERENFLPPTQGEAREFFLLL